MTELTGKVFETIDGMQDEIVEKISEVVRIPSINPKYPGVVKEEVLGGETNANQVVAELYRTVGCEVDVWEAEARRANAVGVLKGAGGGQSLIFNGHIDTVPTGRPEDWRWSDPFSGKVDGGKIYGRGSCDMKGPVVSQAMAAQALQRLGIRLKGDLLLESVVGEEVMDHEAGVTATVRRGYRADAAVVSEASAPVRPLAIVPISPGLLWMAVTCRGKSSHASTRAETFRAGGFGSSVAVNAIDKGVFIFECLRKLEDEWGLTKVHDLFKPGHFTLHPGVVMGAPHGVGVPFFISEFCTIEYAIWYHPEQSEEEVKQEVENQIHHAAQLDEWLRENPPEVEWKLHWPPFSVDREHPICKAMASAHETAARGTPFEGPAAMQGFYAVCDAAFLSAKGIPSLVYGPGSLLQAHAVDEFLDISELMVATKAYAQVAMDWCGVA